MKQKKKQQRGTRANLQISKLKKNFIIVGTKAKF